MSQGAHCRAAASALPVSAESLDEAERTARLADAGANTGNEVLDIVLTEKTLLCQSRKIQLNAVETAAIWAV